MAWVKVDNTGHGPFYICRLWGPFYTSHSKMLIWRFGFGINRPFVTCTKGQSLQRKAGRSHLCRSAAWNWNGMQKIAMITSAKARLPMYRLITVFIRLPVAEIKIKTADC